MDEQTESKQEKATKRIRDVGLIAQIIGCGKILLPILLPFLIAGDDIMQVFASYSYTDLALNICLGFIFIILGSRIHAGPDKNTKKYLWIILVTSFVFGSLNILITGKQSFVLLLCAASIYALMALRHVNTQKEKPCYKIHGSRWLIVLFLMFLLLVTGFFVDTATLEENSTTKNMASSQSSLYTNMEHRFKIQFPTGWDVGPPANKSNLKIVQRAIEGDKNISVFVIKLDTTQKTIKEFGTPQGFAEKFISNISTTFKNIELINYGETTISDEPAYWLTYSGTPSTQTKNFTILIYYIVKDGYSYNISAMAPINEFNNVRTLFEKTANSFEFLK